MTDQNGIIQGVYIKMNYEEIMNEISFIQFHTDLSKKEKNKRIKQLEKQAERFF